MWKFYPCLPARESSLSHFDFFEYNPPMPKVSICIPAYNQAEHLKKAIDSIICQTYTDYEIVITDDSQGTIVKDLVEQYQTDKIKYYKNVITLGSPENWNESIRKASGEYIKILHHDDWLNFDDSLAKYVKLLDDNPETDFAFSATQAIFPRGEDWVHAISEKQLKKVKENPLILCYNNIIGAPSTTIIRKNAQLVFDPKLKWHVDIDYYLRQISNNNNIAYSPELLVVTYIADGRVSEECLGNKEVEVYEFFYLLDKIAMSKNFYNIYNNTAFNKCLLQAITICNNHKVKSVQDIRNCGYHGSIDPYIKTYFAVNNFSSTLGKVYLKFLRTISFQ